MSDLNQETENSVETETVDELTLLKNRAAVMGITYHPMIGVEALRKKVNDRLNGVSDATSVGPFEAPPESQAAAAARLRAEMLSESMKLVRLRITNLNPDKKDLHGEIFTVANKIIGDVKKFVPYGATDEDGYHVPNVIYEQLLDRKFLQIKTRKDPKNPGHMIVEQKWVPEFALQVLPQLTPAELKDLSTAQAAAGRVD